MRRKVLVLSLFILVAGTINAQKLVFIFGHAEYAQPLGDLKAGYKIGFGGEVGAGLGVNKTFVTATVGITSFNPVSGNTTGRLNVIPYKLGVRRYLVRKMLFAKADIGMATAKFSNAGSESKFMGDLGIGVKLTGFEVTGEFNSLGGGYGSWLSLKAGFNIGF
jgi:hypothetical protein